MEKNTEEIRPMTKPGVHSQFLEFFKGKSESRGQTILDVGAGEGALTKSLYEMGHLLQACDLFPDMFKYPAVQCDEVDITKTFPYPDHTFDIVIAVEVIEHILDHEIFLVKPTGF